MKDQKKTITGFSKLSKTGKIKWIVENFFKDPEVVMNELTSYWHGDHEQQKILDGFSENTISNFPMPYGIAPNFLIDGQHYAVPMVIEESSVVAAASSAAKFWIDRGGFKTTILGTTKVGQVHFKWNGNHTLLKNIEKDLTEYLTQAVKELSSNMENRGGGLKRIEFLDFTSEEPNLFQLRAHFETCDSMGANFINSILEAFGNHLMSYITNTELLDEEHRDIKIIMCILSNFTPECVVRAEVSCKIEDLGLFPEGMTSMEFADKFNTALKIAHIDPYRATTHNKGIFNGIDAVVLATGNDFRAIEACGHTYASMNGKYTSLSHCSIENGIFRFWLDIPLAIGTVGGLTKLHPIANRSLELLGNPTAQELMRIIASVGLAQNFSAIKSLVTTGIQKGHMKMHLINILNHLKANEPEMQQAISYFKDKVVSFSEVRNYLANIRK
jgi:hydroxymethylglutaryl-CoA reductase